MSDDHQPPIDKPLTKPVTKPTEAPPPATTSAVGLCIFLASGLRTTRKTPPPSADT